MSEFLVVTTTFARIPALALILIFGLLLAFGALLLRLTGVAFGKPTGEDMPMHGSLVPLWLHVALIYLIGVHMPQAMVDWFQTVAAMLG